MMTDAQVAYAAGFIDGEGCFSISRDNRNGKVRGYAIKLDISNCDRAVLNTLQDYSMRVVSVRCKVQKRKVFDNHSRRV